MLRSISVGLVVMFSSVLPVAGQGDPSSLEGYFTGKMVVAKIDMPGSEKGVDLAFNKATPLDWKEYSQRLTAFGVAIHKGDVARVTKIVVKGDHIEFHLNGGGYGAFGDDTNTTVTPVAVPKSDREKDLEKEVANAKDPKQKKDLQEDLDRERERRQHQEAENQNAAMMASQVKAQQVAERRLHGGSRFNLRWQGSVPSDDRNPEMVMRLLADYIDFDASHGSAPPLPPVEAAPPPPDTARPAYTGTSGGSGGASQLKRGMKIEDVSALLGQGQQISQSVSDEGLRTQVIEFKTADNVVDVTFVENVVVRYSVNSR
jgi:hypothetical protein